jgi:hypothetical protein
MAKSIERTADRLGAEVVSQVPDAGGCASGAARLARVIETSETRLVTDQGWRAGRTGFFAFGRVRF